MVRSESKALRAAVNAEFVQKFSFFLFIVFWNVWNLEIINFKAWFFYHIDSKTLDNSQEQNIIISSVYNHNACILKVYWLDIGLFSSRTSGWKIQLNKKNRIKFFIGSFLMIITNYVFIQIVRCQKIFKLSKYVENTKF